MKKWRKLYEKFPDICHFLESLMALVVLVGFFFAAWHYFVHEELLLELLHGEISFNGFLEDVLNLVIGIEFLKMFCSADSENVLEVLIFLVARHMIVGESTQIEVFVSVLAVCLLVIVRYYIHSRKCCRKKENGKEKSSENNFE